MQPDIGPGAYEKKEDLHEKEASKRKGFVKN